MIQSRTRIRVHIHEEYKQHRLQLTVPETKHTQKKNKIANANRETPKSIHSWIQPTRNDPSARTLLSLSLSLSLSPIPVLCLSFFAYSQCVQKNLSLDSCCRKKSS